MGTLKTVYLALKKLGLIINSAVPTEENPSHPLQAIYSVLQMSTSEAESVLKDSSSALSEIYSFFGASFQSPKDLRQLAEELQSIAQKSAEVSSNPIYSFIMNKIYFTDMSLYRLQKYIQNGSLPCANPPADASVKFSLNPGAGAGSTSESFAVGFDRTLGTANHYVFDCFFYYSKYGIVSGNPSGQFDVFIIIKDELIQYSLGEFILSPIVIMKISVPNTSYTIKRITIWSAHNYSNNNFVDKMMIGGTENDYGLPIGTDFTPPNVYSIWKTAPDATHYITVDVSNPGKTYKLRDLLF